MKKYLLISLAILSMIGLVGCSDTNRPTIIVENVIALRTSVSFEYRVIDEDELIANDSLYVRIYNNTTATTGSTTNLVIDDEMKDCTITGLVVNNSYTATIHATFNKRSNIIHEFTFQTSNVGSEEEPVLITTVEEFKNMTNDREGHFILQNNLDFDGENLTPLFNSGRQFTGVFDGGNYTISNFTMNAASHSVSSQYTGIFGFNRGIIRDLKLSNVEFDIVRSTDLHVGVVAGINQGTIDNVHVTESSIKVAMDASGLVYAGLFVGNNSNGSRITNSSAEGTINITGRTNVRVGGLVGYNYSESNFAIVENSHSNVDVYATLDVRSTTRDASYIFVGGVIGDNRRTATNIYALGDIVVDTDNRAETIKNDYVKIGGVVGYNANGTLNTAFASGNITFVSEKAQFISIGGVVGDSFNGTVENTLYIPHYDGTNYAQIKVTASLVYNNPSDEDDEEETEVPTMEITYELGGVIGAFNSEHRINNNYVVYTAKIIRNDVSVDDLIADGEGSTFVSGDTLNATYFSNNILLPEAFINVIKTLGYTL